MHIAKHVGQSVSLARLQSMHNYAHSCQWGKNKAAKKTLSLVLTIIVTMIVDTGSASYSSPSLIWPPVIRFP